MTDDYYSLRQAVLCDMPAGITDEPGAFDWVVSFHERWVRGLVVCVFQ
jgi:hypothetical protein